MPHRQAIFTLCTANHLGLAAALLHSLAEHEADTRRIVVLAEREVTEATRAELRGLLRCEVLLCTEIGVPALERMAFQYDAMEFTTALKPFVVQFLFREGYGRVVYLDTDIALYQPLRLVWHALEQDDAVVTPHITAPLPQDACTPSNENILRCGQFNTGFAAFANRPASRAFVEWWAERLTDHCIFHSDHFFFADQFYGALIASFVERCRILHHPGLNFAYWNAPQRRLERTEAGWQVDGEQLIFAHFSGFIAEEPLCLSRHQNRLRAVPGSPLGDLFEDYAERLRHAEATVSAAMPDRTFVTYTDGVPIDRLERRKYRDLSDSDKARLPPPFSPALRTRLGLYGYLDDAAGSALGLMEQLLRVEGELRRSEERLHEMRASFSWRLTAPVRRLATHAPHAAKLMRRLVKLG